MKTIVIGFSRPKKWKAFAASIMWADRMLYNVPKERAVSHAYTRFESTRWGCSFFYHSAGHAINFMGNVRFNAINTCVEEYSIEISDEAEAKIGNLCVSREGLAYPMLQQLGKGLVVLMYVVFKKKIKNPFPSKLNDCMEEQAKILSEELGIEIPLDLNSITIEPYRNLISSLPSIKRAK